MLRNTRYLILLFAAIPFFLLSSCKSKAPLFSRLTSDQTNIHFNNQITETDSINVLDFENVYNGGGVGVGDFNNDGLPDLYFTGNLVSNKLYLNKGGFKFDDITAQAGVTGGGKWCRGVAVVDINNDGWMDIYVCATLKKNPALRESLLYINQGVDKKGIPHFKEMAKEYGLADTSHNTQAAFFDYDNDGDLDVYIATNEIIKYDYPNRFRPILKDGSHPSTDKLYRNDWDSSLGHPVFTNVSKGAGILIEGYSHAVTIADINKDGWKDIYVTNDYLSNDLLWINNHDGTFTEKLSTYFKHTSANAMGNDIVDINNDGLADVITLDMNPEDNYRKKMMLNPNSYQTYQNSDYFGYSYQYVRNTLQLNQGPRVLQNDTIGDPVFGEVSFYAGIAETDWSWAPMVADFDNDGNRDIIITNGFPKDVTDHDFVTFRNESYSIATKKQLLEQIPAVKIHNYAFKNNGNLHFTNASSEWGMNTPSFSNGAVYVDLDNDGDLDLVVNNINDEAMVYKNNSRERDSTTARFLNIRFDGTAQNKNGLGAWADIYYDHGQHQVWENTPYRGYLSSMDNRIHFGLGTTTTIDSVCITWPDGKKQRLDHVQADQWLTIKASDAQMHTSPSPALLASNALFKEVTGSLDIHYQHEERDFIDFNIQKLIPHKLSEYGPGIAVGDVDGNGLDDIIIGGSFGNATQVLLQQPNGKFVQKNIQSDKGFGAKQWEDLGLLLFDADGDGDLDLYIAAGGFENEHNTPVYQDKLYINDGKGNFTLDTAALPKNFTSKFCVRAIDYDKDGDLDLFIAGRVDPWNYPKPVSSFIYRNDSKDGHIKFTDVTQQVAKDLTNIGMVCDAVFTDFDNDGWPDLVLAGEWMPLTFLKNNKGVFTNVTAQSGISNQLGWWNTIAAGDFDNDGRIDYVVGNLGQNSFYRASDQYPVSIYAKDFDNNGSLDAFPSLYLPATITDPTKKEFPAQNRDDVVKQMISMRTKFQNYKSFATATMDQLFTKEQLQGALILHANNFNSCFVKNEGNGRFSLHPLPDQAQFSVLNGMLVEDFDGDGNLDVLINGNDYGTEVSVGRYDALNGLLLKGNGKGDFAPMSILQSGIFIPGNGKALAKLRSASGKCLVAATQNRGPLKVFEEKQPVRCVALQPNDAVAVIQYKNGKKQKREIGYGISFLSQSARFLNIEAGVQSVIITDNMGKTRSVPL
ncbi:Repeat domain-containing protein [Hydrobacter penzbergensis]|uniref:Repeat domain-containing protein n=1 Tax=Hydrobacter penzbergensis TaxID=1235997 RepID=A0A8X8LCI6_9BACT|nr:VCBS repeat-containing protein [Hydrobacter penzbergensis]SDW25155.1 Repeat domain-containing protein [Hydrobacter penzbergensis]